MTSSELSIKLARYYQTLVDNHPNYEEWRVCLGLSKKWLSLVESPSPNMREVEDLKNQLSADRVGSNYVDLQVGFNRWLKDLKSN